MYATTLPRSNWLRRASIRLAWYRHMPASSLELFLFELQCRTSDLHCVPTKCPPFYFWNNSVKNKYFNNFLYTDSWGNLTLVDYKFANFTCKMSPHYLVKCKKKHFSILIIGACLFKLLLDKTDSSCHNIRSYNFQVKWEYLYFIAD